MLTFWLSPSDSDYLSAWLTVFIECNIDIQAENPSNTLASISSPLPSDNFQILILGFLLCEHHRPSLQFVHSTPTCSNKSLMSVVLVISLRSFFPYCWKQPSHHSSLIQSRFQGITVISPSLTASNSVFFFPPNFFPVKTLLSVKPHFLPTNCLLLGSYTWLEKNKQQNHAGWSHIIFITSAQKLNPTVFPLSINFLTYGMNISYLSPLSSKS